MQYFAWIPTLTSLKPIDDESISNFKRDFSDVKNNFGELDCTIEYKNSHIKSITVEKEKSFKSKLEVKELDINTGFVYFEVKNYSYNNKEAKFLLADYNDKNPEYKILVNNVLFLLLKEKYHTHIHHSADMKNEYADNLIEVQIASKEKSRDYLLITDKYEEKAIRYLTLSVNHFSRRKKKMMMDNLKMLLRGMGEMSFALSYISLVSHYKKVKDLLDIQSKRIAIESHLRSMQVVYDRQKLELETKFGSLKC